MEAAFIILVEAGVEYIFSTEVHLTFFEFIKKRGNNHKLNQVFEKFVAMHM